MEENMNLKIKFYNNHFTKKIDNKKGMRYLMTGAWALAIGHRI